MKLTIDGRAAPMKQRSESYMKKIVLEVDGMMCGMCESHVNEAIRKAFPVKKVTSSHTKGETVIVTEEDIPEDALRRAVDAAGYTVRSVRTEPYKKGLFGGLFS